MKIGRKSKFQKRFPRELIEHMSEGNSYKSFASKIGVHIDTLYEWEKAFPEFSEAKKVGSSASLAYWEDMGKELARTNAAAYIFNMKNRFGWRDQPETVENQKIEIKLNYQPDPYKGKYAAKYNSTKQDHEQ